MVHISAVKTDIVIVGAGPAGLRAAEVAALSGASVLVIEANRFVGRKFLVAGKSGLNLTNAESTPGFLSKLSGPEERWSGIFAEFSNDDMRTWAADLGFETFESSGGKVFPRPMKAAPLLRAWLQRLKDLGVEFRFRTKVAAIESQVLILADGETVEFGAAILACGGASWSKTGSDGSWTGLLKPHGIEISRFSPANCGWEVDWPKEFRDVADGLPLKNIVAICAGKQVAGELMITAYGLEGGPIYHCGPELREMETAEIVLDLKSEFSLEQVEERLAPVRRNFIREAKRRVKIGEGAAALLKYLPNLGPWKDAASVARAIKQCPIMLKNPRPLDEAISTAGGVSWQELNEDLMLKKLPGVFVAGEMIDWEAPTGGYLLQGCFATGTVAGKSAAKYVR